MVELYCGVTIGLLALLPGHLRPQLRSLKLSRCPWAGVLLMGGFAYFDESKQLISINGITLAPSTTGLLLVGCEQPRPA